RRARAAGRAAGAGRAEKGGSVKSLELAAKLAEDYGLDVRNAVVVPYVLLTTVQYGNASEQEVRNYAQNLSTWNVAKVPEGKMPEFESAVLQLWEQLRSELAELDEVHTEPVK